MTKAEELSLIRKAKSGNTKARAQLVEKYTRWVHKLALKYDVQGYTHEDLVQEGVCGLLVAINKFDPKNGASFMTYATPWILCGMRKAATRNSNSRDTRKTLLHVRREWSKLWVELERDPTDEELAKRMGVKVGAIAEARAATSTTVGLLGNEPDMGERIDERLEHEDDESTRAGAVHRAIASLDKRSAGILRRRFFGGETLTEIGRSMSLSRERVRQIEAAALEVVAELIAADMLREKAA